MRNFAAALLTTAAISLTACGNSAPHMEAAAPEPMMADMQQGVMAERGQMKMAQSEIASAPPQGSSQDNPTAQSFLAYRYDYSFSLPVKSVASTAKSHAQICMDAGPQLCQILGSNTHAQSEDYVNASLRLRAEPQWLKTFAGNMIASVESAKGEMTNSGTSVEDLTRSILDTDARLRAQTTLRTRLEGLLETRNAELKDLLALERELARVQSQIESATTTLKVLRKRVSMSAVTINYQTKQVAISGSTVGPIGRSFKNFFGTVADGLASVIDFIAAILPWLILIIPILWVLRRFWRRRKSVRPVQINKPD